MYDNNVPVGKLITGFFGLVVVLVLISLGAWEFRVQTAGIKGRGDMKMTVQAAPFRQAAYDHFFDLCASVQKAEAGIDTQTALLAGTTGFDRTRILTNVAGLTQTRSQGIYQYNADAAKEKTQGQFQASNLPERLATTTYVVNGSKTQCAY